MTAKKLDSCDGPIHSGPMSNASNIPSAENEAKSSKRKNKEADKPAKTKTQAFLDEVKFFTGMFAFILLFHTFIFGHYKIPSESMQPTLEVGDHLYVSKFAYGYSKHSLPFGLDRFPIWPDGKIMSKTPNRGDVVVFRNPNNGVVMIKRAIGLPGDRIAVSRGRLLINDTVVERNLVDQFYYREDFGSRSFLDKILGRKKGHARYGDRLSTAEYVEDLPDAKKTHRIYERSDTGPQDNTRILTVPAGTILFMGDNRDRSHDSRVDNTYILSDIKKGPGFVPFDHLIGRADMMMFSFKKCEKEEGIKCPPRRFMKRL